MAYPTSPVDGQTYSNKIYNSIKGAWIDNSSSNTSTVISSWTDYAAGNYIFPSSTSAISFVSGKCPIGATVTNPVKGTTSEDHAQWMRDGQDMLVKFDCKQMTAGSAGSGTYLFALPAGYTIDLTKNPVNSVVGFANLSSVSDEASNVSINAATVYVYNNTTLYIRYNQNTDSTVIEKICSSSYFALSDSAYISYRFTARFTCAQFSVNSIFIGMNEPFYLSNSESTINTNGVVSKTKLGIDGSPLLAWTATTYMDCALPRKLLPNEMPSIEVHSKVDGEWHDIETAYVPSLACVLKDFNRGYAGSNYGGNTGIYKSKTVAGQLRVYFSSSLVTSTLTIGIFASAVITWAQVIAAADGYDAWRIRIGQASTGLEATPKIQVFAKGNTSVGANINIPYAEVNDTYNCYDGTVFTAPKNGYYCVESTFKQDTGGTTGIYLCKNGSQYIQLTTTPTGCLAGGSVTIPLTKGETLSIQSNGTVSAYSLTYLSIGFVSDL